MSKNTMHREDFAQRNRWQVPSISPFLCTTILGIALFLGGIATAYLLGGAYGKLGFFAWGAWIGIVAIVLMLLLRQDVLLATVIVVVHLYVDWYLAQYIVAQIITLLVLIVFYFARSPRHPWTGPRGGVGWLWALYLLLTLFPALQGATNLYDAAFYYPNIMLGAFLIFWLGTVIARDRKHLRHLFEMLTCVATLIAAHTILQATTGITLFSTPSHDAFIASSSNYLLGATGILRTGSFFVDPNWNGTFLAMMLFIPLGLFFNTSSLFVKALYLVAIVVIVPALLFTYSNGAWIGAFSGVVVFIVFIGRMRYRIFFPALLFIVAAILMVFFRNQIDLQLQHATGVNEVSLRVSVWQTALRVISAFPLTGIGLGHYNYIVRANPYRVPGQYTVQDHPHNSYLELGAMAGIPVLVLFILLLVCVSWLSWRNWQKADPRTRSLLGAGIAAIIAFSVNSFSINGWTLPPLAEIGWLILGAISSPLLMKREKTQTE